MAPLALSTSATLTPFLSGVNPWCKLFTGSPSTINSTKLSSFFSSRRSPNRNSCSYALSGRTGSNRFIVQASDGESTLPYYSWPDKQKPRVCILGGGFGGLYTALRLESLVWPDDKKPHVLLIDQSDRFVFKPMLYELLSGEVDKWEIAPRFSDLLANTSVQFFQDRVKLLHPSDQLGLNSSTASSSGGVVHLESGLLIEYDWLVLALGAEPKLDVVPGAMELALPFSTLEDACKLDSKLRAMEREKFGKDSSSIRVAVVGCGYAGVELAATVAERLHHKGIVQAINVETTICPSAPPGNREAALKVLSSRNVQLFLGYFVSCIKKANKVGTLEELLDIDGDKDNAAKQDNGEFILELQPAERGLQSQILEADLVLWTVGSKPLVPPLELQDQPRAFPVNGRGQAETDETLRVKGHPRIFAIGDSAALRDSSGKLLPATAQVAFQQADFAGWNLWAAITNRPLLPFSSPSGLINLLSVVNNEIRLCAVVNLATTNKKFLRQSKFSISFVFRFQNLGEMITLGRNDAALSPSFITGLTLEGPIGHTARKIAYLIRLPTDEHRVKVGISWLAKSAMDSVASFQSTLTKALSGSSS